MNHLSEIKVPLSYILIYLSTRILKTSYKAVATVQAKEISISNLPFEQLLGAWTDDRTHCYAS